MKQFHKWRGYFILAGCIFIVLVVASLFLNNYTQAVFLVVGGVLLVVVVAIVVHMVRQRKKGGGCGCGCSDCPGKGMCHPDQH